MLTLKQKRDELIKQGRAIIDAAKAANRDLTPDEVKTVNQISEDLVPIDEQIVAAEKYQANLAKFSATPDTPDVTPSSKAKSLGEHFVKSVGVDNLAKLRVRGASIAAGEFYMKTEPPIDPPTTTFPDTMLVGDDFGGVLTDVDRTIVQAFRRPTVTTLLGPGSISGTSVEYFIEQPMEGEFTTVAEGAPKPQVHFPNPIPANDPLGEIAGWFRMSENMVEDVPFFVSQINSLGIYNYGLAEEYQLLWGDGIGTNILGILNRSGVQTLTKGSETALDTIYDALTSVQDVTGLMADGIIINPIDYKELRLAKDANNQYLGGGPFQGQYGQGGIIFQPPVWGINTVVSAAVPKGTVVVGALYAATSVFRKGGLRVESTNTHEDDFTNDRITTRIKSRLGLAVRVPSAIVKVTI